MISLREYLRAGTRHFHEALDASVRARRYFASREGYRDFLLNSLPFQATAEDALESLGIRQVFPRWRARTPLLLADLNTLEQVRHPSPDVRIRVAAMLRGPGDVAHLLGMAYVLEGSRLGAAVLLREAELLGATATAGARYLADVAAPTWPEFLVVMESHDVAGLDRPVALEAAKATFAAAKLCLA